MFTLLRSYSATVPGHIHNYGCKDTAIEKQQVWPSIILPALADFNLSKSPILPVRNRLLCAKVCDNYKREMETWLVKFENETSEWIEFPV